MKLEIPFLAGIAAHDDSVFFVLIFRDNPVLFHLRLRERKEG